MYRVDSVALFWFGYQLGSLSHKRWLMALTGAIACQILFSMHPLSIVAGSLGVLLGCIKPATQPKLWHLGMVLGAVVLAQQGDVLGVAVHLILNVMVAQLNNTLTAGIVLVSCVPLTLGFLDAAQRAALICGIGAVSFVYQYYIVDQISQ